MHPVEADIRKWSHDFLEVPNKMLNGLPPCPYAKQARLKKTLRVLECHNFAEFQDKIIEGAKITKDPVLKKKLSDLKYEMKKKKK